MLDDDKNGINGGIMQITEQTHVTNLTMFTSAVAQLLSANAISSCILNENKVKLIWHWLFLQRLLKVRGICSVSGILRGCADHYDVFATL